MQRDIELFQGSHDCGAVFFREFVKDISQTNIPRVFSDHGTEMNEHREATCSDVASWTDMLVD